MVEETNPGRDIDYLDGCRAWLAVKIDKYINICLVGFASNRRGASTRGHPVVSRFSVGRAVQVQALYRSAVWDTQKGRESHVQSLL
jgi:hypothetical protein